MQGKGKRPLPLHPIPKTNTNTKINTNNKIKVVYTEDWTHPLETLDSPVSHFTIELGTKRNAVQLSFVP